METLKIYDLKDYDSLLPRVVRNAVKAIIFVNGKIVMMYFKKDKSNGFRRGYVRSSQQ
jgi:TATA-box binding protein (TBP) (component of TFIID and TFIIIB)